MADVAIKIALVTNAGTARLSAYSCGAKLYIAKALNQHDGPGTSPARILAGNRGNSTAIFSTSYEKR